MSIRNVLFITTGIVDQLLHSPSLDELQPNFYEWQIRAIQKQKRVPVVLMGHDGDDLLRYSKSIHYCQLAIANLKAQTLLSAIQDGYEQTENKFFILPALTPCPDNSIWESLEQKYDDLPEEQVPHIIRPTLHGKPLFPYLITLRGAEYLSNKNSLLELAQLPDLQILDLPILQEHSDNTCAKT